MYLGKIAEVSRGLFTNPQHPYTIALLSSTPVVSEEELKVLPSKVILTGDIPIPMNIPPGCPFQTRCNRRMEICDQELPQIVEIKPGHQVRWHLFT